MTLVHLLHRVHTLFEKDSNFAERTSYLQDLILASATWRKTKKGRLITNKSPVLL